MFEWLTGTKTVPGTSGQPTEEVPVGLLNDPNKLMALAQLGQGLGQGQGFGEAAGQAATNLIRAKAYQQAAAKQQEQQQGIMGNLLAALRGEGDVTKLVGPKDDMNTADAITISDKGINLKLPKPTETLGKSVKSLTDKPLESYTGSPSAGMDFSALAGEKPQKQLGAEGMQEDITSPFK